MTWKKVKLGDVIKQRKGFIEIDDEADYKLCRVKVHRKGVVLREELKGFQISTKKQQVCRAGDFIVAEMDAKVGGYGFVPKELDGAIVSSHYFLFELNEKNIRPQYLEVVSQLKILQEQIKAVGSTNYAAIRPVNVLNWEIPLPPIEKQTKIEIVFKNAKKNVEELNTQYQFQLTQIENLNQAILQEAVQGKLVAQNKADEPASELLKRIKAEKASSFPPRGNKKGAPLPPIKPEEIPFEIPESWVWCRLGEICDNITKGSSPNWQGVRYVSKDEGILYITSKNVDSFKIDLTKATYVEEKFNEIEPRSILKKGDILTNIVGASIGRTALFEMDVVANINQAVCILRIEHYNIDKQYLLYLMNSNLALKMMTDNSFAPGRANLSMGNIASFPIPLPSLSEQKRIVTEIEKQLAKTKQLKEHIIANQQATEKLLKALLHGAFEVEGGD
jgi:type I restriction enzyme S subunit